MVYVFWKMDYIWRFEIVLTIGCYVGYPVTGNFLKIMVPMNSKNEVVWS
jgi:hypothetical protein